MKETLQGLLLDYIRENNPELLARLRLDDGLHAWVMDKISEVELVLNSAKPSYMIETECMDLMTANLQPSRIRYLRDLFETEFTDVCDRMIEAGTLAYELVRLAGICTSAFETFPLVDDMENPQLDHAIACTIHEYLQSSYN